jgi:transcriptional regulator with XRE-family HTH domain
MSDVVHPGPYVHRLRTERNLTLAQLAGLAGLTGSMLSKIERGQADPSLGTLRKIAGVFGVPLFRFFVEPQRTERVLHAGERIVMRSRGVGATYEFLLPDGSTQIEFTRVTVAPGGGVKEIDSHPGDESALVVSGTLHLEIGDAVYALGVDDSIHWDSTKPHRWNNPGPDELRVLFVAAPAGTGKT